MAITADKMILYLSGGASNTNPNNSLGGGISTTQLVADDSNTVRLQNLFSNRTASQASSGGKWLRCIFLKNTSSSETATSVQVWQSAIQPAGDVLFIAVGKEGQGTLGDANGPVANESTIPWSTVGLFKSYPDATHTCPIPDLAANAYCAIWVQIKLPANCARFDQDFFGLGFSWNSPT